MVSDERDTSRNGEQRQKSPRAEYAFVNALAYIFRVYIL